MKKPMTKRQLIEIIKDLPDDAVILKGHYCGFDGFSQSIVEERKIYTEIWTESDTRYEWEDEDGNTIIKHDNSFDVHIKVGDKYIFICS
jgi:hypothetical protein